MDNGINSEAGTPGDTNNTTNITNGGFNTSETNNTPINVAPKKNNRWWIIVLVAVVILAIAAVIIFVVIPQNINTEDKKQQETSEESQPKEENTDIVRKIYGTDAELVEIEMGINEDGEKKPLYRVLLPKDANDCAITDESLGAIDEIIDELGNRIVGYSIAEITESGALKNASVVPGMVLCNTKGETIAITMKPAGAIGDKPFSEQKETIMTPSDNYQVLDSYETNDMFCFVAQVAYSGQQASECIMDNSKNDLVPKISIDENISAKEFADFVSQVFIKIE